MLSLPLIPLTSPPRLSPKLSTLVVILADKLNKTVGKITLRAAGEGV
jgi:hypothetical protein